MCGPAHRPTINDHAHTEGKPVALAQARQATESGRQLSSDHAGGTIVIDGITPLHLILVLAIALIVIGPGKLPEVGSALGKTIREFRKATTDVQDAVKFDAAPRQAQAPMAQPMMQAIAAAPVAAAPVAMAPVAAPVQPATAVVAPAAPIESAADVAAAAPTDDPSADPGA